jgi:hypothetical protein
MCKKRRCCFLLIGVMCGEWKVLCLGVLANVLLSELSC